MTVSRSAGVTVRARDGIAGFAGLQHCGSVWSCPVCSASILTHRALEIGAVLGEAVAQGHSLGFGTLTMRHDRSQPLSTLWQAAGQAWGRATSGKRWVRVQAAYGVVGWVRVWEVTDGRNGWHVHVHFVVVLDGGSTAADLDAICAAMFDRWSAGLVAAGLEAPRLVGQEWHIAGGDDASGALADYLFKIVEQGVLRAAEAASLGIELTHTRPGRARADLATRPVWSVLGDAVEDGDADALRRWGEWERGSKGRRQVGWSKGLRDRFAPSLRLLSDEAIVEDEKGSKDDDILQIDADGWDALVRMPEVLPLLLEAVERDGLDGLVAMLDDLEVGYQVVCREPR